MLYGGNCEHYFLGAVTTAYSLMRHLSVHVRVLMHTPDVPESLLKLARELEVFDEIVHTDYIETAEVFFSNPASHRRFGKIFTKYRVLGLEKYEQVLLLDTDLYVRSNIDSLFDLQAPAGMARGKFKHPKGELMPARTPVNAGVLLLRPDAALLLRLVEELTGPNPRRLQNFNSPDADFLTEHVFLKPWASIPLDFNFQLEYDEKSMDLKEGTIRFSAARENHFSEDGARMPWPELKVAHFSGAKPWATLLDDTSVLQRLRPVITSATPMAQPLGEKLVQGLREYASEVSVLQGLCSQFQLGEGVLWREIECKRETLSVSSEVARARLHSLLPRHGRWFEGHRAHAVVWLPSAGGSVLDAPVAKPPPVAAYLEITERELLAVGSMVRVKAAGPELYRVYAVSQHGASLRCRTPLPLGWQVASDSESGCPYYHTSQSGQVHTQWEFPDIPAQWQAITDESSGHLYYHNIETDEVLWDPDFEKLVIPVCDLEVQPSTGTDVKRSCESVVTVWRRSFLSDRLELQLMLKAVADLTRDM